MEFLIKVTYTDGDSFSHYTAHETLDYNWTDEKVVVKNMIAIKEHYEVFRKSMGMWYGEKKDDDYKKKWWYVPPTDKYTEVPYGLNLEMDDGTLFFYTCPWCGYFANLEEIELCIKNFKIRL